jgi:hypothetical protein
MPASTRKILWIVGIVVLVLGSGALRYALPPLVFGASLAIGAIVGPRLFKVERKWAVINGLLLGLLLDLAIGLCWLFFLVSSL